MSENPTNLAAALAVLQTKLPEIKKTERADVTTTKGSYSYTYAGLAGISAQIMPMLGELGLSFIATPKFSGDRFVLACSLLHTSGDREDGEYPLPSTGTPQALGSAITYGRRYTLCAMTGVAPEDDDDGATAEAEAQAGRGTAQRSTRPRQSRPPQPNDQARTAQRTQRAAAPPPLPGEERPQTDGQKGKMHALFTEHGITGHDARVTFAAKALGHPVESTADLNYDETSTVIDWLNRGPGGKQPEQSSLDEPADNPGFGEQP
jgi:hypothetical protein